MGQYAGQFRQIPSILFEHDIYFQSIARQLPGMKALSRRLSAPFEFLRALRYELRLLPRVIAFRFAARTTICTCCRTCPNSNGKVDDRSSRGHRYRALPVMPNGARARHDAVPRQLPASAQSGRSGVVRAIRASRECWKRVPSAPLVVIGSDPPPRHSLPEPAAVELVGFVDDVLEPLRTYPFLFVRSCPVRACA